MARNKEEKRRRVTPDIMRANAAMSGGGKNILRLPKGVVEYNGPEKEGTYDYDFLPYEVKMANHPDRVEEGMIWWKLPFFAYDNVGVNQETIVSPASLGLPCPITEHRAELEKDWDKNRAELKALGKKKYVLYAIKDPADKGRVALWAHKQFTLGDALDAEIQNANEKDLNFYDVVDGRTVSIRFNAETFKSETSSGKFLKAACGQLGANGFVSAMKFTTRKDMDEKETLARVPALEECLNILPYDTIKAIFYGADAAAAGGASGGGSGGGGKGQSQAARPATTSGSSAGKGGTSTSKPDAEQEDEEIAVITTKFEVDDEVAGKSDTGEPVAGTVLTVSSDGTDIEVKDVNGDTYDCFAEDLKKIEASAKKTKAEKPAKAGKADKAKGGAKRFENAAGLAFGVGDTVTDGEGASGVVTAIDEPNQDATIKPKKGAEITLDWDDIKKVAPAAGAAEEPEDEGDNDTGDNDADADDDAYVPAVGDDVEWADGEGEVVKVRGTGDDMEAKVKTAKGAEWVPVAQLTEKD